MISRYKVPEVCFIYSSVSFAYHATLLWIYKVWCPYLVFHFFWRLWKVYATSTFVLLSFLTETLVYLHLLLNLLRHSHFSPCFVLFHFLFLSFLVFLREHFYIFRLEPGSKLISMSQYWLPLFFLVQPCSVLFVEWILLSLALPPNFFYTKLSPQRQMTWLLGL